MHASTLVLRTMVREKTIGPVPTERVLGVPVSLLDMKGTLQVAEEVISSGEPSYFVTADASGFAMCETDEELRAIYQGSTLATPDSQGVVWALRRKGKKQAHRVSGVDLVDELCALSANRGYRIFILGSAPGIAETAAERLRLKHPGCNIVGTRHGYFPAEDDTLVAAEVAPFVPDILFVAMGIPRQEKFIVKTMGTIRAKLAVGVGGSFDVYSGRAKRAPKLVQALKLEWLWRLLLNPSKIGKVKLLPKFVRLVLKDKS